LRVVKKLLAFPLICFVFILSACGSGGNGGGTGGGGAPGNMDVALTTMSAPSAANAGDTITVQTTVVNQGPTLTGGIAVYYYLSLDNSLTTADTYFSFDVILLLDPGQSVTSSQNITLPTNVPSGTYYLGVWADKDNAIAETNESNNQQVAAITITGTNCTEDAYEENDTIATICCRDYTVTHSLS